MGVWEWLYSVPDSLKRNTPGISPVTRTCRKGYDASVHVTRTVTTKARDVHACLSDDHVRGDVTRVAKNLSFNGALYFLRSYGGGPIIDIVSRSLHDGKADSQKERLKDLEAKVAILEKELSCRKVSTKLSDIPTRTVASTSQNELDQCNASADQRLEDVLRNFMMYSFVGMKLFDDLIVPGAGQLQEENRVSRTDSTNDAKGGS